jgi:hypothetical protein
LIRRLKFNGKLELTNSSLACGLSSQFSVSTTLGTYSLAFPVRISFIFSF